LSAVKSSWFIEKYNKFFVAAREFLQIIASPTTVPKETILDLIDELNSEEAVNAVIREGLAKKSIRENAAIETLGYELELAANQMKDEPTDNNIVAPLKAGKDQARVPRLSEICDISQTVLGSLKDILESAPFWWKASVTVCSELFGLTASTIKLWQLKSGKDVSPVDRLSQAELQPPDTDDDKQSDEAQS
jgi:hypothetical protein